MHMNSWDSLIKLFKYNLINYNKYLKNKKLFHNFIFKFYNIYKKITIIITTLNLTNLIILKTGENVQQDVITKKIRKSEPLNKNR